MESNKIKSSFLLILLVIIWGATFPLEKIVLNDISPFSLNISRFLIADLIMLFCFFPTIKKDFTKVWKEGSILGILMSLGYIFQTWGLDHTTPARSGFITSLYVVFVPLVAIFIEPIALRANTIFALLIAAVGIYLSELSGKIFSPNFGDLLTLGCAFAFAFQVVATTVLTKKLKDKHITLTFYQMTFITITNLPFYFLTFHHDSWNFENLSIIVSIAIFASVFGTIIQMKHQKNVGTIPSAFIYVGEPVSAAIFSVILMGEKFSIVQLIGFSLIIISAIFAQIRYSKR
ncbi:MAG: EamA/RhaT family transporter [Thermotoga sp.]|nr:DMT family transporter [Thermotogota bacterium]RKX55812.1 MAG: EamA/RhaT family transporter [Thermotoga sp.]